MRFALVVSLTVLVAAVTIPGASGDKGKGEDKNVPSPIALPNGWQPEGIAIGKKATFYSGSLATGAVYKGSLTTGKGAILVPAHAGRAAVGLKVDHRGRLFVAGGGTGQAYVYGADGSDVASFALSASGSFINDVVVTRSAAWFTDSFRQVLYKVAIQPDGTLASTAQTVPLTGDLVVTDGFNVNGIDATENGKTLVIVQSNTGKLFKVSPVTGKTDEIELAGGDAANGDGILLEGKTLYVVQNQLNRIASIKLSPKLDRGEVRRHLTDPGFDIPTTIARFGSRLYAVNARFSTPPSPTTKYSIVAVKTS